MDKRVGKYANEKKDSVRPKQDIRGNPIRDDEPMHRTRNIGAGFFVVLPLMDNDYAAIDAIIDELRAELKIAVKPVKATKVAKEL